MGGQKNCIKDTLTSSLKDFDIYHDAWEAHSQVRTDWRSILRKVRPCDRQLQDNAEKTGKKS